MALTWDCGGRFRGITVPPQGHYSSYQVGGAKVTERSSTSCSFIGRPIARSRVEIRPRCSPIRISSQSIHVEKNSGPRCRSDMLTRSSSAIADLATQSRGPGHGWRRMLACNRLPAITLSVRRGATCAPQSLLSRRFQARTLDHSRRQQDTCATKSGDREPQPIENASGDPNDRAAGVSRSASYSVCHQLVRRPDKASDGMHLAVSSACPSATSGLADRPASPAGPSRIPVCVLGMRHQASHQAPAQASAPQPTGPPFDSLSLNPRHRSGPHSRKLCARNRNLQKIEFPRKS